MFKNHPLLYPLLCWIITSNRCHLRPLEDGNDPSICLCAETPSNAMNSGKRTPEECASSIQHLETELERVISKKETLTNEQKEKKNLLKEIDKELDKKQPELEKMQAEEEEAKEEAAKYEVAIEEKEDEIFEDFAKEVGVENIREFEAQKLERVEKRTRERAKLDSNLKGLEAQLEFARSKNVEKRLKKLNATLRKLQKEFEKRDGLKKLDPIV